MPIHEYVCTACGKAFEELVHGGEDEALHCVRCGSDRVEKQLSLFAARKTSASEVPLPHGGCGRCGDPNGPCSL